MNAPIGSLQHVLDDSYLVGLDRRRDVMGLTDSSGPYGESYSVDFSAGTVSFIGSEQIAVPAHFIGSAAVDPGSWMWGWHNVNGFPERLLAQVGRVRALGEQYGIGELTAPEVPLTADPHVVADRFGAVASLVTGLPFSTITPREGTVVVVLLESPPVPAGAPSVARAATVIPEAAATGTIDDWDRALRSYAQWRGLGLGLAPGGLSLTAADGSLTVSLDAQGRLTNVRATMGPAA